MTESLTTYLVKMANEFHFADYHVNAPSEEEARSIMRDLAQNGELEETAQEEYEMAKADDRYNPIRSDYTYRIDLVGEAYERDGRADTAPIMVKSGGNG
jgi:hypothetical protein